MPTLEFISVQEDRETIGTGYRPDGSFTELAIGKTRHTLFVRGPSGKLFAVEVPAELADELRPPGPA